MKTRLLLVTAGFLLAATTGLAADRVETNDGNKMGALIKMSKLEVVLEQASVETKVAVNEIVAIYFDGESLKLSTARKAIDAGRYEDALETLDTVDAATIQRAEISQEIQFLKALCAARLALAANDKVSEAGSMMVAFINEHGENYHYFEACELVGDLLVATEKYSVAQSYYAKVAEAPWADYKMRAGVSLGRVQLAQGQTDDALATFQSVLDNNAASELADRQRLAATLGKARCLAAGGKYDEAVTLVEGVISTAPAEQAELQAAAYNALGDAHRQAGRSEDALLAYLHVDVLYFTSTTNHVEALRNLAELWTQVHKPERAAQATQVLRERYRITPR